MPLILVVNAGSSSVKAALYEAGPGSMPAPGAEPLRERLHRTFEAPDVEAAIDSVARWLASHVRLDEVVAVGHRVVHGGPELAAPAVLDEALRARLQALVPLAPLHQPANLAGIDACRRRLPQAVQIACFDTAFHRGHPWVEDTYALPRALHAEGVRRYGFHGLSYEWIARRLPAVSPRAAMGRTVVAHLGSGASLCALRGGQPAGSTMGFSALDGLPMGTRCGQLDPGVVLHLMAERGFDAAALSDLLYRRSGLLGLSGESADMRVLLASARPQAAQAVEYFVHRVRREIGALAAVLEGLDALVFTAGIGEHQPAIRARICEPLGFLGVRLDAAANALPGASAAAAGEANAAARAAVVSSPDSRVEVLVLPTDEERMIATHVLDWLSTPGRP